MYSKHNCDILSNKEGKNKTKLEYDHIHKKEDYEYETLFHD